MTQRQQTFWNANSALWCVCVIQDLSPWNRHSRMCARSQIMLPEAAGCKRGRAAAYYLLIFTTDIKEPVWPAGLGVCFCGKCMYPQTQSATWEGGSRICAQNKEAAAHSSLSPAKRKSLILLLKPALECAFVGRNNLKIPDLHAAADGLRRLAKNGSAGCCYRFVFC
jgi:hypothetical protein